MKRALMISLAALLPLAAALLPTSQAVAQQGQQRTANLVVRASVMAACSKLEVAPVDLGQVTNGGNNLTAPVNVIVNCAEGVNFRLGFGSGQNAGIYRGMLSPEGNHLMYSISDLAGNELGDQGCADTMPYPGLQAEGVGSDQTITAFAGAVTFAETAPIPGQYEDTVRITLCF